MIVKKPGEEHPVASSDALIVSDRLKTNHNMYVRWHSNKETIVINDGSNEQRFDITFEDARAVADALYMLIGEEVPNDNWEAELA